MATATPKLLDQRALPNAAATLYTTPALTTTILKEIVACNTDSAARTVTFYRIASGGSASASNTIISALTVNAGETKVFSFSMLLNTGDFIQGLASAASVVSSTISGVEIA